MSSWKKADLLLKHRLNQHGLGVLVEAGVICQEAERLYPGMFEAVSVKDSCLHLKLQKVNHLPFLMIKGTLMQELQTYCKAKNLPVIEKIRLTFSHT